MKKQEIIIATKNKGKASEFKQFFKLYGMDAVSLLDMQDELADIEETGATFYENAALKAETMANFFNQLVIADDSGLEVDALNGEPGVFSARYAGEPTNDNQNIQKLLQKLKGVPEEKRTARFVCVLAVSEPGKETIYKTGYCEGKISTWVKGERGFGYDPIFIPKNHNRTMAELSSTEKNAISHRKNAMDQLGDWLQS